VHIHFDVKYRVDFPEDIFWAESEDEDVVNSHGIMKDREQAPSTRTFLRCTPTAMQFVVP
jgi:hypothetical protein